MTQAADPTSATAAGDCLRLNRNVSNADGVLIATKDVVINGDALPGSSIRTSGLLHIQGGAQLATLMSGTAVTIFGGAIAGGQVAAAKQISCRLAGDEKGTLTHFFIGSDQTVIESSETRLAQIKATRAKAAAFRNNLEPMLKGARALSADQKEKVTELLFQAQAAEKRAVEATEALRKRLTQSLDVEHAKIVISERIYSGVKIFFPGFAAEITSTLQGPLELLCNGVGRARSIVAKASRTGNVTQLKTVEHCCPIQKLLKELEVQ